MNLEEILKELIADLTISKFEIVGTLGLSFIKVWDLSKNLQIKHINSETGVIVNTRSLTKETKIAISKNLYESNFSQSEIAEFLGCSQGTVHHLLKN